MATQSWIMDAENKIIQVTALIDNITETYRAECSRNLPPTHNQLNHDVWGTLLINASNLRTSVRQLVAYMNEQFYPKPNELILTAEEKETVLALRAGKAGVSVLAPKQR